jgi:hypothetical protein
MENSKTFISKKRYQEDLSRGYTILQFQSSGSKLVKDLRTGKMVEVRQPPYEFMRCMECQFDAHQLDKMQKHLAEGKHPWGYSDGDTPYGPMYRIEFEEGAITEDLGEGEKE